LKKFTYAKKKEELKRYQGMIQYYIKRFIISSSILIVIEIQSIILNKSLLKEYFVDLLHKYHISML